MTLSFILVVPTFMRFYPDWEDLQTNLLDPLGVRDGELQETYKRLSAGEEVAISTAEGMSFITSGVPI